MSEAYGPYDPKGESKRVSDIELALINFDSGWASHFRWAGCLINNHVFVINQEGVGYDLSKCEEEDIRDDYGMTREQIEEMIHGSNDGFMLLRDHIRTFGARLESNYFQWHHRIERTINGTEA